MWSILTLILNKFGLLRGLMAVLGSLAAVLPIAIALVKLVGLPLLVVMFVLGLPLLVVLTLFGFPFMAALGIAGVVLATVFSVIAVGVIALKLFLFLVLPVWLAWKAASWAFGRGGGGGQRAADTTGGP